METVQDKMKISITD